MQRPIDSLLVLIVALPLTSFLGLGTLWLVGRRPSERLVTRLTNAVSLISAGAAVAIAVLMVRGDIAERVVFLGNWFEAGHYGFPLTLMIDGLSITFVLLITTLIGLVGHFSATYLHRERGFFRFFALLHLFAGGMLLIVCAATVDLLFAGWELVGITSSLLIAFFDARRAPVENALRTFVTYRACDVGLLAAAVFLHHFAGSAAIDGNSPAASVAVAAGPATLIGLLLLWAAMGKSAQVPLSGWLPRAMEGPTPSSAIFYGALSIHAGAYLLLRFAPLLEQAPIARTAVVVVGLATAIHGTLVGRVQTDAKCSLAYASMTQVGIILAEIGLGLQTLALVHTAGHAIVRTLQLLRAPSILYDYHQLEPAMSPTGGHYERVIPERARLWLYRLALARGHHDELVDRLVVRPLLALTRGFERFEQLWADDSDEHAKSAARHRSDESQPALANDPSGWE